MSPSCTRNSRGAMFAPSFAPGKDADRFPVLTAGINAVTMNQTVDVVAEWIETGRREYVNVCTSHTTVECYDSPALARAVNASGLAVPDGMPLVWLGRLRGRRVGRVYGPDLMLALCRHGESRQYRHFFYGGTPQTLERLEDRLRRRFPRIVVAGRFAAPFRALTSDETAEVVKSVNQAAPDIVWVGLGTPKQDYWMATFRPALDAPALIGIGAAFNFHAGTVDQAPRWIMSCGLEWLYRLFKEPRRLWRRYLLGNPRFVYLAGKQLLTGRPPVEGLR